MLPKVNPLRTVTVDGYTVEVFDFADLWILPEPAPSNWHELVYRVSVNGVKVKGSARAARVGTKLVADLNRFRTPEGQNAFIAIADWLKS